jgi:hypothetical protein
VLGARVDRKRVDADAGGAEVTLQVVGECADLSDRVERARQAQLELATWFESDVRRGDRRRGCPTYSLDRYGGAGRAVGDEELLLHGDTDRAATALCEQAGDDRA